MADRVILTIGTKKGVFVADAAKPRRSFALRGPFGPGVPVYSTLIDARGTPRPRQAGTVDRHHPHPWGATRRPINRACRPLFGAWDQSAGCGDERQRRDSRDPRPACRVGC